MIQHGPARRWRGRRGAALAGSMAIALVLAGVWITGGGSSPRSSTAGSAPATTTSPSDALPQSSVQPTPGTAMPPAPAVVAEPAGLRLSAGHGAPAPPVDVVRGTPLTSSQIAAVISRLPAWAATGLLPQPFRWPTQSIARPPAGRAVPLTFPGPSGSPTTPDRTPTGPLHVLRMQPQGAVSIAPFASITFDHPMVPITTVGRLQAVHPPATITPAVAGTWQWIGTTIVRFAPDSKLVDRLPMATEFTVTVPAGTRAADGATLAQAATATFSTPPPTVQHFQPTGPSMPVQPVFVAVFDQRMDPRVVLAHVRLSAGGKPEPIRPATAAEVAADAQASSVISSAPVGRAVAFRPIRALPVDSTVTVSFPAGTASAEGPRTSGKAQTFSGRTYAGLALARSDCGGQSPCQPSTPLNLTFNNTIDATTFDATGIVVRPAIPGGATVNLYGSTIVVQGATQADTTYRVSVPTTVRDVFGQRLAAPAVGTVHIGPAIPRLDPFPQPVTTLDPMVATQSVTVTTLDRREFRERVFAVSPSQWLAFQTFFVSESQTNYAVGDRLDVPAWPVLVDRVVTISGPRSAVVSTRLDLSSALGRPGSSGAVVVLLEPTSRESFGDNVWQNRPTLTWAQSTTLGLDALNDATKLRAWVTDLRTGAPLPNVTVGLLGADGRVDPQRQASTDAGGIAALTLTAAGAVGLLATSGGQSAILPSAMWNNSWAKTSTKDRLLWFVTDDRQTYRPGETVSVKGFVRRQDADVAGPLTLLPAGTTVSYTAGDADGIDIGHGTAAVSRLGGFSLTVTIPAGANLGGASILLHTALPGTDANDFQHPFTIADFRTPDFQVDTSTDSSAPAVVGKDLTVDTDATYYAGGPLSDAAVNWQVRTAPATYAPPGWNAFTFGIWTPWWQTSCAADSPGGMAGMGDMVSSAGPSSGGFCCEQPVPTAQDVQTFSGRTDPDGHHYLQVQVGDLGKDYTGLPVTVTAQATVTDLNQQAIAGTTDLLVHPADDYVGLSSDDTFVARGKDIVVQAIATDIDGAAAPGRTITVRAAKVTTSVVNGVSVDAESDPQTCRVTSGTAPVSCTFTPAAAGSYHLTGTVVDDKGRISRSQLTRWVAGPDGAVDSSVQLQQVTLVPDRKEYQPGGTARLLVQSPIRTGSGLLTLLHNGIVSTTRFPVTGGSAVVSVPITAADLPGVTASVEVVGTAPRAGSGTATASTLRPAYATGNISLSVSTQVRTLKITAVPRQQTVAPGGSTAVDVTVTDAGGQPLAGSEFELVVADEAVLALGGYQLPDPMQAFYPTPPDGLTAQYGRSNLMLADPPISQRSLAEQPMASAAAASGAVPAGPVRAEFSVAGSGAADSLSTASVAASPAGAPIAERTNFAPLALFVPSATTDARGRATISVPLPDSLTRYRVMVVAVAGSNQFGTAESTITAALPLTVRPTAPRFLNFGDTLQLPVLVQNQTDTPLTTQVVLQAANLRVNGPAGQQVTVPARGRVELRFGLSAAQAGTGRLRVAAVSGAAADAASVDFPVYTPTTTETFASYGVVPSGVTVRQPVSPPTGVVSQFGGLQISTSSTALQQLTDAVGYLANYDYDSSDGFAGQILAIGSIGDVLAAFSAPGLPSPDTLKALVATDVTKLTTLQNDDGGFPYWQHGDPSDPFNSIQSTQALLLAARQGFVVSRDNVARAEQFLTSIDSHIPADTSQATRDTLHAYALAVLMQGGHRDAAAAEALVAQRGKQLPLDAVAWLLPVVQDPTVVASLEQLVNNAAVDDAGSVTFTNQVTDDAWTTLQSDRRTDGLILDALIAVQPTSDLIPKVVSGLLAAQTGGRWSNIEENSVILVALRHYYDVFEKSSADFVAGVWLGDRFAGQHQFLGHTTDRATVSVPTSELVAASDDDVTLRNAGTGRLYYRLALQTAPTNFALTPVDRGFVVSRTYQAVDQPGDVTRDAAGVWHIKAGARVKVQLQMVSRSAQTHVGLIDPLPAGLEILNPDIATTPKDLNPKTGQATATSLPLSWYPVWYDHQNLRDDQAEAFAGYLQGGVYQYSYLARATTDGTFVAPPTRAEQVYAPETFGRGASDRVVIAG